MLQGRRFRKMVAATLLTIMLTNTFAPGISYALTSGPTQPEATSFEPIDTTDMVNQQSGDFTYNVPLIEVPGPDGGYPLSLAYHAGILPNQDASWVGLGWTLNPGEINRSVSGYPDDWLNPKSSNRVYWSGGQTTTYNVGISIGLANSPASVNFGLAFASDTYHGFGVGVSEGIGLSRKFGPFKVNANLEMGITPFGQGYASAGANVSLKEGGMKASMGVSASTNFQTMQAGASGGIGYGSSLGVSMSTTGSTTLNVEGVSASATISNSNSSRVSTSSHGFGVDIPIAGVFSISLGFSKVRYWTDETQNVTTMGSMHSTGYATSGTAAPDNYAYDQYSLLDDTLYKPSGLYSDPTKVQGGAYPDFDAYSVNAQGLGGTMRPYLYQGGVLNQNIKNGSTPLVTYYNPGVTNMTPMFRFDNDFSNTYQQNDATYTDPSVNLRFVTPPLDASPVYGYQGPALPSMDGNYGAGYGTQTDNTGSSNFALAGSQYVDLNLKVHPRNALGYVRSDKLIDSGMIEGFSITNASGMTYHFGLPAYSYGEENYQENIKHNPDGTVNSFNRVTRNTPYAYTWYLTTITGPDFVDRNGNGIADDGDWGYWVDFEYGKWSGSYNWRNPSEGFQKDQDDQFQNVSLGIKEVYYLNAIRTRSHLALFEKDLRYDGKGESQYQFNKNGNGNNTDYTYPGLFDFTSSPSLQLSRIYLLNASDEGLVTANSDAGGALYNSGALGFYSTNTGIPQNVLDVYDVTTIGRPTLEAKALRVIDFNYNYSLCQGTTNSFNSANAATKMGKLILTSVVTRGKGGVNLLPATQFSYDLTGTDVNTQAGVTLSAGSFSTSNGSFHMGDMIMESLTPNPDVYCGVINSAPTFSNGVYTYSLSNGNYTGGTITATIYTTKNPPYNKDAYDGWGMYKSDYDPVLTASNENLGRTTTAVSAAGVDAWTLRTITSPLGSQIKIGMESDQIINSVYNATCSYVINSLALDGGAYNKVVFKLISGQGNVGLTSQSTGNIVIQTQYVDGNPSGTNPGMNGGGEYSWFYVYKGNYTVTAIDGDGTVHATLANPIQSSYPSTDKASTYTLQNLYTGNISLANTTGIYGGGLRTNHITLINSDGTQNITAYNYNDPSTHLTSGVTSYMPSVFDTYDKNAFTGTGLSTYLQGVVTNNIYRPSLNSSLMYLFSIGRELPPPQVLYQYVTVTSQIINPDETISRSLSGSTMYQFEVFRNNMVGIVDLTTRTGPIINSFGALSTRNLSLQKFTGSIGTLKRTTQFDNNGKILSESVNHYLHDNLIGESLKNFMLDYKSLLSQYNYQGYIKARYFEVKEVLNQASTADNGVLATLSEREDLPCIQIGRTDINYVNGTKTNSQTLGFDFYSGEVTKSLVTDAYGNNLLTETIPAYRFYPAMGLKIDGSNNKNMLSQTAETRVWTVDGSNNKLGLASASINTWSDLVPSLGIDGTSYTQNTSTNGDVWRQQSTYNWMPTTQTTNGLTATGNFADFNWTTPASSDNRWKKTLDVTTYDVYSKALEERDVNGNYAATHMTYGENKVMLTGGPAGYYEIAYSGAEDGGVNQTNPGFIQAGSGTVATGTGVAHTGAQSLLLGAGGQQAFIYSTNKLVTGRTYTASVWVKPVSGTASNVSLYYNVNGGAAKVSTVSSSTSTRVAGNWTQVNLIINGSDVVNGSTIKIWCENDHATAQVYVDDMRIQPINASTTAYVYDPFSGELTDMLDNSNLYTRFEYDAMGRLLRTYKEKLTIGEFKTNQYAYNYGAPSYTNDPITNVFYTKNNCAPNAGYTASNIQVSIPGGTYTSFISKDDANKIAGLYAQDYANTHGSCTCTPIFTSASVMSPAATGGFSLSGTRVNFIFEFTNSSASTDFVIGNIAGSCALPSATRTIQITKGSSTFNVLVYPNGNVEIQSITGPVPTTDMLLSGVYDLNVPLFYSASESGYFTHACTPPAVGNSIQYVVPAYKYAATDQTTANNLALADVQANGQSYANSSSLGTCSVPCTFSWNSGMPGVGGTISSSGTTGSFNLNFTSPSNGYSGGTIGTITGGCLPVNPQTVTVTDAGDRTKTWNVTISSNGTVQAYLSSFTNPVTSSESIILRGTYKLN